MMGAPVVRGFRYAQRHGYKWIIPPGKLARYIGAKNVGVAK